jgi:hypothetical protein
MEGEIPAEEDLVVGLMRALPHYLSQQESLILDRGASQLAYELDLVGRIVK